MSDYVKEITDSEFAEATAGGLVLVDFWAPWCGPCQMMAPILDAVAQKIGAGKICKINVDENTEAAGKFGVQSIPTMVFFKDGNEVGRVIGAHSEEDMIDEFAKYQ